MIPNINATILHISKFAILSAFFAMGTLLCTAEPKGVIGIECESFEYNGSWNLSPARAASQQKSLRFGGGSEPAVTSIILPESGLYTPFLRSRNMNGAPGGVELWINGNKIETVFAREGGEWRWERAAPIQLQKGENVLAFTCRSPKDSVEIDALILSKNPKYSPRTTLFLDGIKGIAPATCSKLADFELNFAKIENLNEKSPQATLSNGRIKIDFVKCTRGGKSSVAPVVCIGSDRRVYPDSEAYAVVRADDNVTFDLPHRHYHPQWSNTKRKSAKIDLGNSKIVETSRGGEPVIWNAGVCYEAVPKSAKNISKDTVEIDFYPTPVGNLKAVWVLKENKSYANVRLNFSAGKEGQYSLGYFIPVAKPIDDVSELLMPMLVQRKRFPRTNYSMLQGAAPTPMSVMSFDAGGEATFGVVGDDSKTPFEFPTPILSHYVMQIKNPRGLVQPSTFGPIIGTEEAFISRGDRLDYSFNAIFEDGSWYDAYRCAADEIFGLRDYRSNTDCSLTDACLNMADLMLDDKYGGWWESSKGFYQIESHNGASNSAPMIALSLYRIMDSEQMYDKRALPILEYSLSRSGWHFSEVPHDTGKGYGAGSMSGPLRTVGSTVFDGLDKLCAGYTPRFADIAFPAGSGIRIGSKHDDFAEKLAKYEHTKDKKDLDEAIAGADWYIARNITGAPDDDLGLNPFFLCSFVPKWESMLRFYEVTGEKRFLDAAELGAKVLMTGVWTQPRFPEGKTSIHLDGEVGADKPNLILHRGDGKYRLGFPIGYDTLTEKEVDAWRVSNVGLSFEQPCTYTYMKQGGRMIMQSPWAPNFLRLAQYTKDKTYETYARNAVVGRWGNYPGYYYTDFSDITQSAKFPYEGPDISFIYYHHLPVHLSWSLDYLISDSVLKSGGKIKFPSLRQFGYAYFDCLIYGHEPGEICGHKGAWLWINRNLVKTNNPQINWIAAHTKDKFFAVFTNQSDKSQKFTVWFNPKAISKSEGGFEYMTRIDSASPEKLALKNASAEVSIGPRQQRIFMIDSLDIRVDSHRPIETKIANAQKTFMSKKLDEGTLSAVAIAVTDKFWDAYAWMDSPYGTFKNIEMLIDAGGRKISLKKDKYPYDFSARIDSPVKSVKFKFRGTLSNDKPFETEYFTLERAVPAEN